MIIIYRSLAGAVDQRRAEQRLATQGGSGDADGEDDHDDHADDHHHDHHDI